MEQVEQVMSQSTPHKMFAILNNENIIIDGWFADSYEEAKSDNPDKKVMELTLENSPVYLYQKYEGEI